MKKFLIILGIVLSTSIICGCSKKEDINVTETKEEVEAVLLDFLDNTQEGDYTNSVSFLTNSLAENFAPVSFVNTMISQYPDSQSCASGAKVVAEYILTQLYIEPEIEKIDVSQDLSEVRILMTWSGINPATVDTTGIRETIDELVNAEYQNNQTSYDENTYVFGADNTNDLIRENCFPEVFKEIRKLFESAETTNMKGVFCFSYITNDGWKITGIYEYTDLMYDLDNNYDWNFEKAQESFEKGKMDLDSTV